MIRVALVAISIVLFLIITLPVYFVLLIVGIKHPMAKAKASQKVVRAGFRIALFFTGGRWTVIGAENVPKDTAVMYAGNHRGFADIAVGYVTVPTVTGFVAKKEIKKVPVFSWWMKNMNCLFLDRDNMKEGLKTILQGVEYLKQGYSIFIMPEGTRNKQEGLLPFKEGSFKMAEKAGVPIIPVAISNSDAMFEKQFPKVKPAHVIIHYGEPVYPDRLEKGEKKFLGTKIRGIIEQMLEEDKKLI